MEHVVDAPCFREA
jgi:hypothetical protein